MISRHMGRILDLVWYMDRLTELVDGFPPSCRWVKSQVEVSELPRLGSTLPLVPSRIFWWNEAFHTQKTFKKIIIKIFRFSKFYFLNEIFWDFSWDFLRFLYEIFWDFSMRFFEIFVIFRFFSKIFSTSKFWFRKINFQKSKIFDDYFLKSFLGMERSISSKNTLRDTQEHGAN